MIKKTLVLALLCVGQLSYSQDIDFYEYDLDELVLLEMPGEEVYELDTIANGLKVYQLYTYAGIDNTTFIAQKTDAEEADLDPSLSSLPYDEASLRNYYETFSSGVAKGYGLRPIEDIEITKQKLIGRKVFFADTSNTTSLEADFFLINRHIYVFSYYDVGGIETEAKNYFLNSYVFDVDKELSQFDGEPRSSRIAYFLGRISGFLLVVGLGVFLIIRLSKGKKKPTT